VVKVVRYGAPAVIGIAGIVFLIVGTSTIATTFGIVLIGIAVLVALVNVFARLSISSEDDRDREERARQTYSRTGRWTPRGRPGP
jgi:ABC-type transport system involved in cytochrome bd biosynthesis fused ATPase/permease subunit